jgi:hypothetical protein
MARRINSTLLTLLLVLLGLLADGSAQAEMRGVYHPYVNQGEREIEYGVTWRGVGDQSLSLQRASIAYAWTDRLSTELYLLSEYTGHGGQRLRQFELEAIWQIGEQGEYWADWALTFEVERTRGSDENELSIGVLWEKELGQRWVATANAYLESEFGGDVDDELETGFRGQLRFLHSPLFEPALEVYLDDEDYAAGPAVLGAWRLSPGRQLRWELGVPLGLTDRSPSISVRLDIEIEF